MPRHDHFHDHDEHIVPVPEEFHAETTVVETINEIRASVLAEDMLFATLDPTMRALSLPHGGTAIGYLLRGPSRTEWEHSIPGVERLRYSITFRNFLERSS